MTEDERWSQAWFVDLWDVIADLPNHSPEVAAEIRKKLGEDPVAFAILYFRAHLTDVGTGTISFSEVHFEWCRIALGWRIKATHPGEDREAVIGPREVGKSTWWFLILPLWAAANGHKRFAVAFAHSGAQAEGHLSTLKHELDSNILLRNDFPDLAVAKRRPGSGVTLADRQGLLHTAQGFVFAAKGADTQVLGLKVGSVRPDLLILDDIEPDESNYSAHLAEKRLSTVTDAIFPLNVRASVVMVGTVTMPGSIMHQLVKAAQGVEVEPWIRDEKITAHYYRAIQTNDDGSERSIWPEKWPIEWLQSMRHTRSFMKNFDNDPMAREGVYWLKENFHYDDFPCTRTALFVDPAVTAKDTSDFTGLAIVGMMPRTTRSPARCLIKHAAGVRLTGQPLADHVGRLLMAYPEVATIVVEVNQGGDLWLDVFKDLLTPTGRRYTIRTHTAKVNKETRFAESLEFWQRGLVAHRKQFQLLEEQAVAFPRAQHDDVIDAACQGAAFFLAPDRRLKVVRTSTSYLTRAS
jgi:phage terminase large subunit-like protein